MCVYVLLLIRVRPGPDDRQPQRWCSKLPVQQRYTSLLDLQCQHPGSEQAVVSQPEKTE